MADRQAQDDTLTGAEPFPGATPTRRELVVNRTSTETRVALLEDGCLTEVFLEREESRSLAGNIYKMDSSNVQRIVRQVYRFTVDLTNAKPGDVLELGDVTGKKAKSSK